LLFYTNYEAYRLKQQSPVQATILTPEARQGIFRYRVGDEVRSFNVLQAQGLSIDPAIQNLLSQVPTQGNFSGLGDELNTTGYSFNARDNTTRDNLTAKLDYYLSTAHSFSGSYIWNRDILDRPDQTPFYTAVPPVSNDQKAHFMSASWRWNPSATFTNELRGGMNRPFGSFVRSSEVPPFLVANSSLIFDSPVSEEVPEERQNNTYSIQNNANWVKGRHALAFGFQATMWRERSQGYFGTVPTYTIGLSSNSPYGFNAGTIPGASTSDINVANSLLSSLAGLVSGGSQTFNISSRTSGFVAGSPYNYNMRMDNYAPYFLDTWKIRRNLTLILGLRWEYFSPVDERNALALQPVDRSNVLTALLGNPTLDFAGKAVGRPLYERDLNNFAPNVGFAWDVFGNGRTAVRGGYAIAYANDNNMNTIYNTFSVNQGLTSAITVANQNGRLTGSLPAIPTPQFQIPTTLQAQFDISPSAPPVQGIIDPKLRSPYVQQWNFGVEQEWRGFVFSGRYVANHTVGQYRQIDYNQIDPTRGGFLQDFIRARSNAFLSLQAGQGFNPTYNANIAGSQQLPFFSSLPGGGLLTNATVSGAIRRGEAGSLAQTYQTNGIVPSNDFSFFPNPLALYSSMLTNIAHSTYNSGQFEVTKRMFGGMQIQGNYVFSKALSNAGAFRSLEAQLDNNNPRLEKARATYDLTHALKVNHYLPLPFGPGQRFQFGNGFLDRVFGGWALSGFMTIQSGSPVSILSNRGTLNRGARSIGVNTANTNVDGEALRKATGLFINGNGVYFVDPRHIGPDGRGVAPDGQAPFEGQLFSNPEPGSVGNLQRRYLDGPWYKNYDFSLQKTTQISERQSVQLRADFFNLFNNPSFWPSYDSSNADHDINSVNFGRITSQYYAGNGVGPRTIQFGLFYRF
ncbi:MAG TPA: hypothetical protein VEQ63_06495, partial [Bryobacteraceae bacterium]|nr:hypothetical protein [Bryobacteraceae bacterium]